jgi:hypothetical protein
MTQRAVYRKVTGNQYEESTTPYFSGDTPFRYYDPEAEEAQIQADKLLAEKQALLDQIPQIQYKVCAKNSDLWAIKFQDSEFDDDLTAQEKQDNKDFNKKVIKWRKKVRQQNNGITTANTKEEIQARLTRLDELEASYPNV